MGKVITSTKSGSTTVVKHSNGNRSVHHTISESHHVEDETQEAASLGAIPQDPQEEGPGDYPLMQEQMKARTVLPSNSPRIHKR